MLQSCCNAGTFDEGDRMTYPSKVDSWVGIVLVLVPVGILLEAVFLRSIVVAAVAASVLVLYGLAIFPTNYTMRPDALTVRSGVIRTSIPYQEIRQVRGSRSWLSAPALSLDRLQITYGSSRTTLISPRNRAAFLRDLSAHVPGLRFDA
jgi:membrane protein YdbS with pleckstrin-like domain